MNRINNAIKATQTIMSPNNITNADPPTLIANIANAISKIEIIVNITNVIISITPFHYTPCNCRET